MDHSIRQECADESLDDSTPNLVPNLVTTVSALAATVVIIPMTFENLSDVRYLHAQSVKNLASGEFSDDEYEAAKAMIYSAKYSEALSTAISRQQFFGAWIGGALVGTAGWSALDETHTVARIRKIFVSPLYSRMGIAQKLLTHVEAEAAGLDFRIFSVRSMANANGFFLRHGYRITSHGVRNLFAERSVPVTFLRKTLGADLAAV
jgi:GNAT superfamily N-acetyltransferase